MKMTMNSICQDIRVLMKTISKTSEVLTVEMEPQPSAEGIYKTVRVKKKQVIMIIRRNGISRGG